MTKNAEGVGLIESVQVRSMATIRAFAGRGSGKDHRRIFQTLVWVSVLLVIAKMVGAGREIAIAGKYGVSPIVDAYSLLSTIVGLPVSLFNNVLVVAVLPLFATMSGGAPQELRQFQRETLGLSLILAAILWCGVVLWGWHLLQENSLGLAPGPLAMTRNMFGPFTLFVPLGVINCFLATQLMARGKVANSLLDGVPALITLASVLVFSSMTPAPLIWGMVGGTFIQGGLLIFYQDRRDRLRLPSFRLHSSVWRSLASGVLWIITSQIVLSFVDFIDQAMVVSAGPGANAEFGYANRLLSLPLSLGVMAIIRALLPALAEIRGRGGSEAYVRRIATQWATAVFLFGLVALIVGWFVTPYFVRLLYQHGAFTPEDARAVSTLVWAGLLRMPIYFLGVVVVQFIASRADYSIYIYITGINVINIVVKLVANYLLIKWIGAPGAMVSTAIMYAFSTVALIALATKMPPGSDRRAAAKDHSPPGDASPPIAD